MTDTFKSGDLVRLEADGKFLSVNVWSIKSNDQPIKGLDRNSVALVINYIDGSLLLLVNESVGWIHDPIFLGIRHL